MTSARRWVSRGIGVGVAVPVLSAWMGCVGAAEPVGSTSESTTPLPPKSAATKYTWSYGANSGGGFANAGAVNPLTKGEAAVGGDVWGTRTTTTTGASWAPGMDGASGIGQIYTRAMAYSQATPGLVYVGIGTLSGGGGYFGTMSSGALTNVNSKYGFGTTQAKGAAADQPRAVGQLIVVDYVTSTTPHTEYVYALTNQGLAVSTDGGSTFAILGPASSGLTSVPDMAWKALAQIDSHTLLAASYRTSMTAGSSVFRIQGIHDKTPGNATVTSVTSACPVVEDIRNIGGAIYAACGDGGVYEVTGEGMTWTAVGGSAFSGTHVSSIDGVGSTLYAGTSSFAKGSAKSVAKSTDGGKTWTWVSGATHVSEDLLGTTTPWWLGVSKGYDGYMGGNSYVVSQIYVDPSDVNVVYSFGRSGAWVTQNGGTNWYPAMIGMNGTEATHVRVDTSGGTSTVVCDDTDWTGESSTTEFSTCARDTSPGSFGATKSTTTVGGHTYKVTSSVPVDVTKDGASIADAFLRSALVNFSDVAVDASGYVYIAQFGGGILVGTPSP